MKFINIGKIVNTHGLKGELRILSNFRYKDKVLKKGMNLYIGKKKEKFIINTYRFHKIYDMVTFNGFNNINDVEYLKGLNVYINEDDLILDGEIYSGKLIGFKVMIKNKEIGQVSEVFDTPANEVIRVNNDILIPYVKEFINEIDMNNNIIYINNIGGLIDEV